MNSHNKLILKIILLICIPIIILITSFIGLGNGQTICLFNNILGVNCIGCGTTKSIISFMNGEFIQSFNYNYNIIIILPLLLFIWWKHFSTLMIKLINNY